MTNFKIIGLLMLLPAFLLAQGGIINDNAKIQVSAGTQVKIGGGGVINQNNGEITNEGNMYIDVDWTQLGVGATYTGNGWMWFENGTNQSLTSASPISIPKLRVDNGDKLILGSNVIVTTEVDFMNNGSIELGANNLTLSPAATMSNYDATSYVITNSTGVLQREVGGTAVEFPIGNSTYNPAILTNAGVADNFQLRVFDQVFDMGISGNPQTTNAVDRTWMIEEEVLGGSDVTITTQWSTADEMPSFARSISGISHHLSGTLWDNPLTYSAATNIAANTWTQTRSGFTSFSPFVIRDANIDLPVELLYFNAERQNIDQVQLNWATALEINNDGFEVQRMLDTETTFQGIDWVEGNGTTTIQQYYELIDHNSHAGISFYRLKQMDFDGTVSFSEIRAVEGLRAAADIVLLPNPTTDMISVRFGNINSDNVLINIYASDGKLLVQKNTAISANQILAIPETYDFIEGTYMLQAVLENGDSFTQKFIKQER